MSDSSLLSINDTNSNIVFPEPENRLNIFPLPLADMVSSPLLLTNNYTLTIITTPPLLNDDKLDVKLNNPLSSFDHIPALTVTDLPSLESTYCFNQPLIEEESPITLF